MLELFTTGDSILATIPSSWCARYFLSIDGVFNCGMPEPFDTSSVLPFIIILGVLVIFTDATPSFTPNYTNPEPMETAIHALYSTEEPTRVKREFGT